jgi:mitochondrial cardiolipin hydrolase
MINLGVKCKKLSVCLVVLLCFCNICNGQPVAAQVNVIFTESCEDAVVAAIEQAREEILLAIYTFSNRDIAKALVKAKKKRNVNVRVKIDTKQIDYDAARDVVKLLKTNNIKVTRIKMRDWYHMHHKFMVIDRRRVLTGSYNYTIAASTINYENLVTIDSPSIARRFIKEFEAIKDRR